MMEAIQLVWEELLSKWPYSERLLFIISFGLTHNIIFWGMSLSFLGIQYFGIFEKYRIRRTEKTEINWKLVKESITEIFVTHWILQWVLLYFLYDIMIWSGTRFDAPLPTPLQIVLQVFLSFVINDFLFYWTHRLFHHPLFYARFHKKHHRFTSSIGFAAEFASPVETFLANSIPTLLGPIIFGSHYFTLLIYLSLRVWETVESHSGYDFPWSVWSLFDWQGGARAHDFHHSHNIGNFGGVCFSFWDTLMGTDQAYRKYLQTLNNGDDDDRGDGDHKNDILQKKTK